jgi:hypothetical protein
VLHALGSRCSGCWDSVVDIRHPVLYISRNGGWRGGGARLRGP